MEELLDKFKKDKGNAFLDCYKSDEASIIAQPIECGYHVKRMREVFCKWVNSQLPGGIEQFNFQMMIVDNVEYDMHQNDCVELVTKIIDGKGKHTSDAAYYADAVVMIGEKEDEQRK